MKEVFFCLVWLVFCLALSGCISSNPGLILSQDVNRSIFGGDINSFLDLNDTSVNYVGSGSQCVAVNAGETGLEFVVCASGISDTTIDTNINALFNFLGKSYDWNKDQNFLSSNIFDLNLGKDSFAVNGTDFNVFDLNTSVLNQCSGDANHVLTSANLCQFIGGYGAGGGSGVGDGNFYSIPDHNILFAKISDVNENFLLIADSNEFSRLFHEAIADWNIAVLNSNDWSVFDDQNASDINFNMIETPKFFTLSDWFNSIQSSGRLYGGDFIDNGNGTITVTNGTGIIKSTDSNIGENYFFDWDANANVGLHSNEVNYIFVDYNSGTPFITVTTDRATINHTTEFSLGRAWTTGATVHVITSGTNLYDYASQIHERLIEVRGFERASGGVISETGILNIASTAGVFYLGSNRITTTAQDTNDLTVFFTSWYRDGGEGWTEVIDQNQIDDLNYDDGTGTLNDLTANRYGVYWVFIHYDSDLHIVYGRDDYKLNEAENAVLPSDLPEAVSEFGTVAAKIIIQKNAVVFTSIASAYTTPFPVSNPVVHNDLSGLQGGTASEYYHLTLRNYNIIEDFNGSVESSGILDDINAGSGRFAGFTASTYDGNVYYDDGSRYYGYVALHKICASIYPNAHACTTDEIILTIADGNIAGFTEDAWVQEGPPGYLSNSNDCVGWTNKSASGYYGAFFLLNTTKGGYGSLGGCSGSKYFACCN